MKNLFYLLLLIPFLAVGCSSDDDPEYKMPIEDLSLPESSENAPVKNTETIIIYGIGFEKGDEIWFSGEQNKSTANSNSNMKRGETVEVTGSYIKVTPPKVYGKQKITMVRASGTYDLGTIHFQTDGPDKRIAKLAHANDSDHDYYAFQYDLKGNLTRVIDGDDDGVHAVYSLSYKNDKLTNLAVEEIEDDPYVFDISYSNDTVFVNFSNIYWSNIQEGCDTIIVNDKGNPVKISYAGAYRDAFTYDEKGNIATKIERSTFKYTYSYDEKISFIANTKAPSWLWLYHKFDLELDCGLVNNIVKRDDKEIYSYTYDSYDFPRTIKDFEDDDNLQLAITYEFF